MFFIFFWEFLLPAQSSSEREFWDRVDCKGYSELEFPPLIMLSCVIIEHAS